MLSSTALAAASPSSSNQRSALPRAPKHGLRDAGFFGELRVRSTLRAELPTYLQRSNVLIPRAQAPASELESDVVLVGFNGVFVIEVKYWTGTIIGGADSLVWEQRRYHPEGYQSAQPRCNAIAQVTSAAEALRGVLGRAGYHERVEGIVVFAHPKVRPQLSKVCSPVCMLPELVPFLRSFPRIASGRSLAKRVVSGLLPAA